MSASFKWRGGSPDEAKSAIREGLVQGLAGVSLVTQKLVRGELSKAGTGRRYRVTKRVNRKGRNTRAKGWHVASVPGAPPAALNGHLRASWTLVPPARIGGATTKDQGFAYIDEHRGKSIVYVFGSNLRYARALEYGFRHVAARPYIRPVVEVVKGEVEKIMAAMMKRTLRGKK